QRSRYQCGNHPVRQNRIQQHRTEEPDIDRHTTESGSWMHMDFTLRWLIDHPPLMAEMRHEWRQRTGTEKRKEKDVEPPKTFEHEQFTNRGNRQRSHAQQRSQRSRCQPAPVAAYGEWGDLDVNGFHESTLVND